jgi:anaerobic magnesium-protoporphyrin IX monomethyl ester cyclase
MIILYNPVSNPPKKPVLPMSLLSLGALIEGEEEYRIIDGNLVADGLTALRQALRETGAKILGMTVMPGPQLSDAVPICKALKAEFPALTIVWGGYFPSLHCDVVMKAPYVDFVFRGHCEREFAVFLRRFNRGEDVSDLAGLAWRRADGEVKLNPKPPMPNVNELPDFPYERVPMERYMRNSFMGSRTIAHHSSYGCPSTCNFCGFVHKVHGRYSAHTAERTAAAVYRLVNDYRANAVEFYDSNFFVQESRIAEFSERITPLGIGWWGFGRPDTMLKFSDKTWSAMSKSGLKMVFMGAETADDEVLRRMNKGGKQTSNTILAVAEKAARFGIVPEMSFIVGNPPDPEADLDKTLRFIRVLKRINPQTEIVFYVFSPVPVAGDMLNEALTAGFKYPESLEVWIEAPWEKFAQHLSSSLPWMTNRIRRKVANFQQVLHAAYPTITDPKLKGVGRLALKSVASWRYATQFYAFPVELKAVNRIFPYNRPEISGF